MRTASAGSLSAWWGLRRHKKVYTPEESFASGVSTICHLTPHFTESFSASFSPSACGGGGRIKRKGCHATTSPRRKRVFQTYALFKPRVYRSCVRWAEPQKSICLYYNFCSFAGPGGGKSFCAPQRLIKQLPVVCGVVLSFYINRVYTTLELRFNLGNFFYFGSSQIYLVVNINVTRHYN